MEIITELPEKYVIVGPDDHDELPTYWNNDLGWVSFESATRFDARILTAPLPAHSVGIMNVEEWVEYIPLPTQGVTVLPIRIWNTSELNRGRQKNGE